MEKKGPQNPNKKLPKPVEAMKHFCDCVFSSEKDGHKIIETVKSMWMIEPVGSEPSNMTIIVLFDDVKQIDHITKKKVIHVFDEARALTKQKYGLNIYPAYYNLTDYWELIRHGSPVTFHEIQSGIPLYDPSGFFVPFKKLIDDGRIPGTKESMKAQIGRAPLRLIRIRKQFKLQIVENIYNAVIDACQAPLMLIGVAPPAQREVATALDNHFVKKGKLEPEYVRYVDEIVKYFKDIEHGEINDITGYDIDRIVENGIRVIERAEQLMEDVEKEKN